MDLFVVNMAQNTESTQIAPNELKNRIREYWNKPETRAPYTSRFGTDSEIAAWKTYFRNEFKDEKLRILDVGTGAGFLSILLAELGHEVVGIDMSKGMIAFTKKVADESELDIDLIVGDAESLGFDKDYFDVVVSRWVLWTLLDPEKAINEWMRVLKPGGRAYEFGVVRSKKRIGLCQQIKQNLGFFLIMALERKDPRFIRSSYGKDLNGKGLEKRLPLHHSNTNSNDNEWKFFENQGFVDLTVTLMKEVDVHRRKKGVPLQHKLAWGNYDKIRTYCLRGRKPVIDYS